MVRPWMVVILIALLVNPWSVLAQTDDPEAVAQALVDKLMEGDYTGATENFDDAMLEALPAERLQQVWEALLQQVGAFQQQTAVTFEEVEGATVVIITLQFEKAALNAQVSVNAAGQVTGLYFASAELFTYQPPDYADPETFVEQDVTIGSGEWVLPGTLTLPEGDGPFPAVVLVHGSGPNDRDETIGPNKPFKDLAWGLASRGIAVVRYDKRTLVHGQKMIDQGDFTAWEETIDDALAAVELLRQTEGIDPARIFVLGHSLGGYLAPRITQADPQIAGVIIMAGNTRSLEDLTLMQVPYLLELDGELSEDDQAQISVLEQQVQAIKDLQPGDEAEGLLFNAPAVYWLDLKGYDPVALALSQPQPMLILQGERDYQVTMDDFQGWQAGLAVKENVTFTSYPGFNHLFIPGEGPATPDEYNLPGHVAQIVINNIADWILAQQPA